MDEPMASWTRLFAVSALYSVVITVLLSPLLLWLYRWRVTRWMQRPGSAAAAPPALAPGAPPAVTWQRLAPGSAAAGMGWRALLPSSSAGTWRIVAGYAVGGLACALVLTACFGFAFAEQVSTTVLYTALLVFLLPVLATGLYLLSARVAVRVGAFSVAGALLYLLLGYRQDLGFSLFTGFVLLPVLLLLVFSLRFWRGVAPMVMILALPASLLAVAMVEYGAKRQGLEQAWAWRLAGFAAGALLGYAALRALQRGHETQRFSDLELFVDAWWLVYLLQQTVIFVLMRGQAIYFVALLSAVPFVLLRRLCWRVLPVPQADRPPRDLLLLRVFADSRRTQTLFDRLEQRWRHVGNMRMIAGWDLALRNIGPADFVAFLGGHLKRQFVRDERDLAARLQSLHAGRDADGRYRVEHFWCHADTWQATMRALAARCQAVLMDLRGFTADREGCRYELLHLARHAPGKPVLLLVDSAKAYEELRQLLGGSELANAPWIVADLEAGEGALDERLVEYLAARPR
jgi:hypothetical protein